MSTLNGNSLFSGIYSGLNSTYSLIASENSGNVTLSNIASAMTNSSNVYALNPTFASYLQTNFNTLDTNRDGTLSSAELSSATSRMLSMGLSQYQLTQLGTASGLPSQELSEVLEHFADIDTNGDGRVTTSEITAYNLKSQEVKKQEEFENHDISSMSVFYGDDDSSSTSSSSMLDYKYNIDNSNSSSSSSSSS